MNNHEDGLYVEFFAIQDGQRYNAKIVCLKDLMHILANSTISAFDTVLADVLHDKED